MASYHSNHRVIGQTICVNAKSLKMFERKEKLNVIKYKQKRQLLNKQTLTYQAVI